VVYAAGDKHKCNKWSMQLLQTTKTRGNSGQLFLLSCAHVQTCTYIHTGLPFHKICLPRFLTGFLLFSNIFLAFPQEHTVDHHPCQPNIAKKRCWRELDVLPRRCCCCRAAGHKDDIVLSVSSNTSSTPHPPLMFMPS
jgi:hypothetical protein